MDTPVCDFVKSYRERGVLRLHMPGHKGRPFLGMEPEDITEIAGADELYRARGVIRRSEDNAAYLFGAGRTVYSAEGSSLCIRAMVRLALLYAKSRGRKPLILAGRNAHRAFLSAAALLDAEVQWLYPGEGDSLISCTIGVDALRGALDALPDLPAAVYVTSPDYLGHVTDIASLARVCHEKEVPLLVDNAHGAYLRFLPEDRHPIALGADLCCDSAHKTLPVLTGGAYLHIGKHAPEIFSDLAEPSMALFASSSPSYLILQSLDAANACLAGNYREKLAALTARAEQMKRRLVVHGYDLMGDEPIKITLAPKAFGYTGDQLHGLLREKNMECEFSDPDFLTMMLTPSLTGEELERLEEALLSIPRKTPVSEKPPRPPRPVRAMTIREAVMAPQMEIPVEEALGRVLAGMDAGCPPCVPILACGERIDEDAVQCFRYYGIETCHVTEEV